MRFQVFVFVAFMSVFSTAHAQVFINEVDYNDPSTDDEEFIELVGARGMSLAGWSIELIDGADDSVYATLALTDDFIFGDDTGTNRGFYVIGDSGVTNLDKSTSTSYQNGPDGIRLLNAQGELVHFFSYAGVLTGTNDTQAPVDSDAASSTIYKTGSGSDFGDYSWTNATGNASPGAINSGQSFEDVLVAYYDFDDGGASFTNSPEYTVSGVSGSEWSDDDATLSSLTGSPATGRAISASSFDDGNAYEFTLTVSGGTLDLTGFHFDDDASGTGPTDWELFINGGSVATGLTSADFLENHVGDLSLSSLLGTVTVRLEGLGASGGTGSWRIDNFVLTGNFTETPVPAPAALPAGLAMIGLVAARRRRR